MKNSFEIKNFNNKRDFGRVEMIRRDKIEEIQCEEMVVYIIENSMCKYLMNIVIKKHNGTPFQKLDKTNFFYLINLDLSQNNIHSIEMIEKLNAPFLEGLFLSRQLDYEESNRITSIRPFVKMDQRLINDIWIC